MNLLQAIEQAGDNWFRPKAWRGYGSAFSIGRGLLMKQADDGRTTELCVLPIESILGKWEIVTPEQVIAERAK